MRICQRTGLRLGVWGKQRAGLSGRAGEMALLVENEPGLMFVFCFSAVCPPHDDEEPALTTYGRPLFPDHLASATHPVNSPRGRSFVLFTQEEKLHRDLI